MKVFRSFIILALVLFVFTGCDLLAPFFSTNSKPTVSLSYDNYTPTKGLGTTITATAFDSDEDVLSYSWYINDVLQTGVLATDDTVAWTPSATGTFTIKVVVSDGKASAEATLSLTMKEPATLRINNNSDSTISYVYIVPAGASSWGNNLLGSYYISPGYYNTFSCKEGSYDMRVVTYYDQSAQRYNQALTSDQTFTWNITN